MSLPIALQLWSVKDDTKLNFSATVRAVAAAGYDGVELAGYGNTDAAGAKAALAAAGLKVAGMHVGPDRLRTELRTVIEEAMLLGTRHITCPWWNPVQFVSPAACEAIGLELATWGATVRSFGLQLSYHNHDGEMKQLGGQRVIDWILGAAAPRDLAMEPDVFWVHTGGMNPSEFLRRYGARCPLVHIKDAADLGNGPVNFPPILETIRTIGAAEWLVIEQESFHDAPLAAVARDVKTLRNWLA